MTGSVALDLTGVRLVRDGRAILDGIDWRVRAGERWVVVGPNGSGKTTLCRLASLYVHPSEGAVSVLGHRMGRCDVRALRAHVGVTSQALADLMRPELRAADIVLTGRHAALTPWWHEYEGADRDRAAALLARVGCAHLAGARYGTLSAGERQRVLLARALVNDPRCSCSTSRPPDSTSGDASSSWPGSRRSRAPMPARWCWSRITSTRFRPASRTS